MKFLCICEGGVVRSVSLARVLKDEHHQDAIAASWRWNSQETLDLLSAWADKIVLMQPKFADKFARFREKILIVDVGPDVWANPLHPQLMSIVKKAALGWASKQFKI